MKDIKYTDSLLACIFADPKHKEYAMHLYNDLLEKECTDSKTLMVDMEKEGICISYDNYGMIILDESLMRCIFHGNAPYRAFAYMIKKIKVNHDFPIPVAYLRFAMFSFYTGKKEDPLVKKFRLSDLYSKPGGSTLECIVLAYNIEHEDFTEKFVSEEIYEYSWCVDKLNRSIAEGNHPKKAVKELLNAMPDDFVIKKSLQHKKKRLEKIVREEITAEKIICSE